MVVTAPAVSVVYIVMVTLVLTSGVETFSACSFRIKSKTSLDKSNVDKFICYLVGHSRYKTLTDESTPQNFFSS